MPTALEKEAVRDTYSDMAKIIKGKARNFSKRFGADFDEVESDLNLAFMEAFRGFDSKRASWSTHTHHKFLRAIQMRKRTFAVERAKGVVSKDMDRRGSLQSGFSVKLFLDDLSEDGKYCVGLVLTPSFRFRSAVQGKGQNGEANPYTIRNALREVLREKGWTVKRVNEAFSEIATALS